MYLLNGIEHCKCQSYIVHVLIELTLLSVSPTVISVSRTMGERKERYCVDTQYAVLKNILTHHRDGNWKVEWEVCFQV